MDNNLQDNYELSQTPQAANHKVPTGLIITTIICTVLAVTGVALSIYGLMDSNQKSERISDLEAIIDEKDAKITELETAVSEVESGTEDIDTAEGAATLILGDELSTSETTTVFKIGDCTADGTGDNSYIKCPVATTEGEALVSYHYNDGVLRLSLNNE